MSASTAVGTSPTSGMQRKKTSQGAPSAPTNLLKTFVNASIVTLSWEEPRVLNGELSHYVVRYGSHEERVSGAQSAVLRVVGYTNYSISVQACSQGHHDVACGPFSSTIHVMTAIGVSMKVSEVQLSPDTHTTIHMGWQRPAEPNGPISYYVVRYRPSGGTMVWAETRTPTTAAKVRVDCGIVDGAAHFDFQVYAVNEVDGVALVGQMSDTEQFEMCNISETPVVMIALSILLPAIIVTLLAIFIMWCRHSDFFKPVPDPYFIEAVLDHTDDKFQMSGRLLNKRTENEKFDALKKADSSTNLLLPPYDRLSSKESTSTSSSTDQGIHDMDGFTDEMRYVSEKTGSRSQSMAEEDKPLQGKHAMRAMGNDYEEDDGVFGNSACDGSVTYSRIAEADGGAEAADSSTPMLGKEAEAQYISDGSEVYAQLSQVPPQPAASATPPPLVRGLGDQRSEASFGSQSTVSYHRLGTSGLTPITSVETLPSEDPLTYSRLSQGSEPDVEYSQLAATSSSDSSLEPARAEGATGGTPSEEGQGVAMSLPSVPAGSCINPQQEFIVATALAPGNHPHPVSQHDNAGYVMSPPLCKIQPPTAKQPKQEGKVSPKNLADSKCQSGSDSSLTDGEGYSTLGLAEPLPNLHQPSKPSPVDSVAGKSLVTTQEPNSAPISGYMPHDTASPPSAPRPHPVRNSAPAPNGYVTESDLQSIPSLPKPSNSIDHGESKLLGGKASPVKHIPSGLPKPGENGYVTNENLPAISMPPKAANPVAANPYVPHEQAAGMGPVSSSLPKTPPTSLNNNTPLPPGKDLHANDPYVGIGGDVVKKPSDFTVC